MECTSFDGFADARRAVFQVPAETQRGESQRTNTPPHHSREEVTGGVDSSSGGRGVCVVWLQLLEAAAVPRSANDT